jgi:hypothetical protein
MDTEILNHAPVGFSFIDCFARRETDQRPSRLLFSSEGHLLKKITELMYKPNSCQLTSKRLLLQQRHTFCRSADRAAARASLVGRRAVLLKRQKKIAGLTRRSFCRRSWDRPPTVARLLPFPSSVVPGAQPCPFSFVCAPTLSDASDMFDFP